LVSVALCPEVHLRSVDLYEPDALAVPQGDGVSVCDVVDSVDARPLSRRGKRCEESDDDRVGRDAPRDIEAISPAAGYAFSQAIPSLSRSSPLLYDIARR
jgi:hypothetical protein